ncbi:hypothetical protein ACFP2T_15765 [Plantactinospora solaniradicis]|uniref:Uncharacterized protein n=1 Tax=Plantactinospora solaniradicis TaxID=1723736 RepID=A0ABW1KA01_9ACTN
MEIFLSPQNPFGAIVLAVIASALVTLARVFRRPLIRSARRIAGNRPRLLRLLRNGADRVYPTWREGAGYTRQQYGLRWRIAEIRKLRRPPVVIAGGLYLDVHLTPVDVENLDGSEYGNLDTVQVECGGSALFMGRYLFERYGLRSHLFSRLGSGDPLSDTLCRLLEQESWIEGSDIAKVPGLQCGVSAHLLRRNGFHTTFTHMGALGGLRWGPIAAGLKRKTRRGGVLYISGYFRTDLCTDLIRTLQTMPPRVLVCVDHGRFRKEENPRAASALTDAFAAGLVDLYVCTYSEITELMASAGLTVEAPGPEETLPEETLSQETLPAKTLPEDILKNLRTFAEARKLPPVTIVRGGVESPHPGAYVMFEGKVEFVRADVDPQVPYAEPGRKNAFNAALVHELAVGRPDMDLSEAVMGATQRAVQAWLR